MAAVNGATLRIFGRLLRRVGQGFEAVGRNLQGQEAYVERLVPSTRVVPFKGKSLQHGAQVFVASSATTVGDVTLGEGSSVWYGATVRGDAGGSVSVGAGTAILDNAVVLAPATLGKDVVIGSGAVVRGAAVGNGAMIGLGAVVEPGATVGADSFVDAGAVVPAGASVPAGELWSGRPARFLRALTLDEMKYLRAMAGELAGLSGVHAAEGAKSVADVEADAELKLYRQERGIAPDAPMPETEPEVLEYYKLTETGANAGLFRETEYDAAAEARLKEAAEQAADAEENAHYYRLARMRRVSEALKSLAATRTDRPEARDQLLAELRSLDPEAEALVQGILARARAADAAGKAQLGDELGRLMLPAAPPAGLVDTLSKH